jgi:hypothetical protein
LQREREKGVQLGWRAGGKIRIPGEPWHHAAPVGVEGSLKRAYEDPRTLLRDVPSPLRPLDRLLCRTPSRSSILLASAGRLS